MSAQGQSSSAKRGGLAAVSSGLIFLQKKKKIHSQVTFLKGDCKIRCSVKRDLNGTALTVKRTLLFPFRKLPSLQAQEPASSTEICSHPAGGTLLVQMLNYTWTSAACVSVPSHSKIHVFNLSCPLIQRSVIGGRLSDETN